ncbi:hypothetical protein M440DRAFT_1458188 [Trichoderma longibrachiatum ATCC 18648]|uniref:Uncharacterized protein n=1 Tax=Trichoderma longibrachiatum ATCC 18648 TaxID=983965 RepID=A0A2T4C300_TRILO|nr:hypothetical protein M440DRAFT_1458188 [Trichoderma longibrachiatum ATCC 18648]
MPKILRVLQGSLKQTQVVTQNLRQKKMMAADGSARGIVGVQGSISQLRLNSVWSISQLPATAAAAQLYPVPTAGRFSGGTAVGSLDGGLGGSLYGAMSSGESAEPSWPSSHRASEVSTQLNRDGRAAAQNPSVGELVASCPKEAQLQVPKRLGHHTRRNPTERTMQELEDEAMSQIA